MNIRALKAEDIKEIRRIHDIYFADKFDFPDFLNKFLCAFVIEQNNEIIAAGGVRTIAESILITNLSYTPRERREALLQFLNASLFTASRTGYDSIHAFVQDDKWKNQLLRYGFKPCKGDAIILGV